MGPKGMKYQEIKKSNCVWSRKLIKKAFSQFLEGTHIVKICGGKCVVGSHQHFLISINYHKIPLRIFLGGPTYCQNMWFKICGRSRSNLKMSNN